MASTPSGFTRRAASPTVALLTAALSLTPGCGRIGYEGRTEEPSPFTPLGLPPGGEATRVAVSPSEPDTVYALMSGRVFRSTDAAAHWTECAPIAATRTLLAIDPRSATTLYVSTASDLMRSTDGCGGWTSIGLGAEATALAFMGEDLWVGARGLARLSGVSWSVVASPADGRVVRAIAVAPNGRTLLVGTEGAGVVRSIDAGVHWASASAGLASLGVAALAFDPGDPTRVLALTDSGLHTSTDGGASWSQSTGPGAGEGRDTLAIHPTLGRFVVMGAWSGLSSSANGGASFDGDRRNAAMAGSRTLDLAFDPRGTGRLYAATTRRVFIADDGSFSWVLAHPDLAAWEIVDLASVPASQLLGAATPGGFLRSEDDGDTWELVTEGFRPHASLTSVEWSRDDPAEVRVVGQSVSASGDGGRSFVRRLDAAAADAWWMYSVHAPGPLSERLWVGTGTRVLRSDDGGSTAVPLTLGPESRVRALLQVGPSELWVGTWTGAFLSIDDGATFTEHNDGLDIPNVLSLVQLEDGSILAGTAAGLYRASDASSPWTLLGLFGQSVGDVLVTPTAWVAATTLGVWSSRDRGRTWTELPGLAAMRPRRLALDGAGRLIVGTSSHGLWRATLP